MGNKCCGSRNKPEEKTEKISEYTTKYTSKDISFSKDQSEKRKRKGICPYCQSKVTIPENLKYIECPLCREKSMQDGCTTSLYK